MKDAATFAPLVLIAFNRPDLLRQQLEIVRAHYRGTIYAIVDGPRSNKPGEANKVIEVLQQFEALGKDFTVILNKSTENLGCYRRIKSGLDWVFEQTDQAIILEDDCMPSPQWFGFATEMLNRYAVDERIYSISGTNLFPNLTPPNQSYFFSRYHNCWGWATWSRAWKDFIDSQEEWLAIRNTKTFRGMFRNYRSFWYWRQIFDRTYGGEINSWFYRWMLSCWMQSSLSIHAHANLISNIGDGVEATKTKNMKELKKPIRVIELPFIHEKYLINNKIFDINLENKIYSKSAFNRLKWIIQKNST